jgi:hypothetical protein
VEAEIIGMESGVRYENVGGKKSLRNGSEPAEIFSPNHLNITEGFVRTKCFDRPAERK